MPTDKHAEKLKTWNK